MGNKPRRKCTMLLVACLAVRLAWSMGCSVSGGGGGGGSAEGPPSDTTVEFPETGDELIITTNPTEGDMTVYGDTATAAVSRIVLTHPDGALDAEFDGQGRPTRAVVDGNAIFDITHNADGTFNYTLTENGAVISTGGNLTPAEDVDSNTFGLSGSDLTPADDVDPNTFGLSAKDGLRTQATELDLRLCVDTILSYEARNICVDEGFPDTTENSRLAQEMLADQRAFNASRGACRAVLARLRLTDAQDRECPDDHDCTGGPCCIRASAADTSLQALQGVFLAVVRDAGQEIFPGSFIGFGATREELCSETGDSGPADTGDDEPGGGDDDEIPTDEVACCIGKAGAECLEGYSPDFCVSACGVPYAPGVTCDEVVCDEPTTPCCLPIGPGGVGGYSCILATAFCCSHDGGTPLAEGADCSECNP